MSTQKVTDPVYLHGVRFRTQRTSRTCVGAVHECGYRSYEYRLRVTRKSDRSVHSRRVTTSFSTNETESWMFLVRMLHTVDRCSLSLSPQSRLHRARRRPPLSWLRSPRTWIHRTSATWASWACCSQRARCRPSSWETSSSAKSLLLGQEQQTLYWTL